VNTQRANAGGDNTPVSTIKQNFVNLTEALWYVSFYICNGKPVRDKNGAMYAIKQQMPTILDRHMTSAGQDVTDF
jgi:hypothetical protein